MASGQTVTQCKQSQTARGLHKCPDLVFRNYQEFLLAGCPNILKAGERSGGVNTPGKGAYTENRQRIQREKRLEGKRM